MVLVHTKQKDTAMSARSCESTKTDASRPIPRGQDAPSDARLVAVVEAAYILEARTR
jgi:transposase